MSHRRDQLSWVHFGDLHTCAIEDENYRDFLELIDAANQNLAGTVDFAFLPGDNAEDGVESQYRLVREALNRLKLPVNIIAGDHDRKMGTLDAFRRCLEPDLSRSVTVRDFRLLFLNAMDGADSKTFDFGPEQFDWLQQQLARIRAEGLRPLVFVHLYPSELATKGGEFTRLIRDYGVEVVDMGHTHYNELANDGLAIYSTTRSTGQIEEGPPGFSLTVIDDDVVSWKFKPSGPWPFAMITSPADHRLITRPFSPRHVLRGTVHVRARAWNRRGIASARCFIDNGVPKAMHWGKDGAWQLAWESRDFEDGYHSIRVEVESAGGHTDDQILVLVNQSGEYMPPARRAVDYENTIGAWLDKGILGTQLGPNENGIKGPWPSWRGR